MAGFVLLCELLLPLAIVSRDPERVLELLLPTFAPVVRILSPMTRWIARTVTTTRRGMPVATPDEAVDEANETAKAYIDTAAEEGHHSG